MGREDRALASGLLGFFAMLVVAALLYTLFNEAAQQLFITTTAVGTGAEAQAVIDERQTIWGFILAYAMLISGAFLIARAVVESRRGI